VTPDDAPSVWKMMAAVAILVAVVILVFFGLGYLLGRMFL
jgi:preprotein translocase subunit SecE